MKRIGFKLDRRQDGPQAKRLLKRQAARRMRRLGRLLLDDAPRVRRFAGWWS